MCVTALVILAAIASAAQASTAHPASRLSLKPVDGGRNYYAKFSHALPTSKSYFPIGMWLRKAESRADFKAYADFGVNLFVGVENPEFNDEALIRKAGMRTLIQADERTRFNDIGSENAGWLTSDEVDMTAGPGGGYGQIADTLAGLPQDGKLRYTNYGKGVLLWESDAEAERFVNRFQQIVSTDLYWFTDPNQSSMTAPPWLPEGVNGDWPTISGATVKRAANYGYQIDRVRALDAMDGKRQPVWGFVELGWPFTESASQGGRRIQPAELRAAVWQSIIAGARGIIYFDHNFGPGTPDSTILGQGYSDNRRMAKSVNAQIKSLAPVLNSPTVSSGWSQGPGTSAIVKWAESGKATKKRCKSKKGTKCKRKGKRKLYVFAGSAGSFVKGRFSLPCVDDGKAAVVGEGRRVPVRGGSFRDRFADGNAIHIYRIDVRSKCAKRRQGTVTPIGLPGGGSGRGEPLTSRHTTFWAITAAMAALLVGLGVLARLSRGAGLRSGKRATRSRRLGTR